MRLLQRREELRTAASTVVQRAASLGITFLELQVCPYCHTREGLTPAEALEAVCEGFAAGAAAVAEERCASGGGFAPVLGGIIVEALRARGPQEAAAAVLLARQYAALFPGERPGQRALVLGLALTSPPYARASAPPLRAFEAALRSAVGNRLPVSVAARLGTDEPGLAIALGAQRLRLLPPADAAAAAHCVSERSAAALATLLRGARATATFALSADVAGTGHYAPSYAAHPLRALVMAGVPLALACDALMAGGPPAGGAPTPAGEIAHAVAHAGLSWQAAREAMRNAARGAFFAPQQRAAFLADYDASLDAAMESAARAAQSGALPAVGGSSPEALAAAAARAPQAAPRMPRAADSFSVSLYGITPVEKESPMAPQPLAVPVLRSRPGGTPPSARDGSSGEASAPRFAPFMQLPPGAVDVTHPRDNEERVLAAARTQMQQRSPVEAKPMPRTTSGRSLADAQRSSGARDGQLRNAQSFASMRVRGFSEHSLALTEGSGEGSAAEGYWQDGGDASPHHRPATGAEAAALAARAISSGAGRAAGEGGGADRMASLQRDAEARARSSACVAGPSDSMQWLRAKLGYLC